MSTPVRSGIVSKLFAACICRLAGYEESGDANHRSFASSNLFLKVEAIDAATAAKKIAGGQFFGVVGVSSDDSSLDDIVSAERLPGDISDEGRGEIESFAMRHHLSPEHHAAEISAYAAVKVFVEALCRGGRDVTREKVIASLEHLYGFATGVTPAITYGPNRHIGTVGAYVVGIDFDRRTFSPASRWITPAE